MAVAKAMLSVTDQAPEIDLSPGSCGGASGFGFHAGAGVRGCALAAGGERQNTLLTRMGGLSVKKRIVWKTMNCNVMANT